MRPLDHIEFEYPDEAHYPGWVKLLIWIGGGAACWVPFIAAFYAVRYWVNL